MNDKHSAINRAGKASILLASMMSSYAFIGLSPILPQMQEHFADVPGSAALVRFMITVLGLSIVIGAPIAGLLADRFGMRPVLIISTLGYASGAVGLFLADLYLLIASRVIVGLSVAAMGTLMNALIISGFPPQQRNRWLGLITTASALSTLALLPVSGLLGQISWRAPFIIYLFAIVQLLLIIYGIPGRANLVEKSRQPADEIVSRDHFPAALILTGLVTGVVAGTPALFLPFHLADLGETDPARLGLGLLPTLAAVAAMAMIYGHIRARVTLASAFVIGFGIAAAGLVLAGFASSFTAVLIAQGIAGMGFGILSPNLYAFVAVRSSPAQRGGNVGATRGAFYAGPLLAQLGIEPVMTSIRAGGALISLGVCASLAGLVFIVFRRNIASE